PGTPRRREDRDRLRDDGGGGPAARAVFAALAGSAQPRAVLELRLFPALLLRLSVRDAGAARGGFARRAAALRRHADGHRLCRAVRRQPARGLAGTLLRAARPDALLDAPCRDRRLGRARRVAAGPPPVRP